MKSIKSKILLPVFLMSLFFITFMSIQFVYTNKNSKLVKEMNAKHFSTISKADELKLSVVQVQQWLTDMQQDLLKVLMMGLILLNSMLKM